MATQRIVLPHPLAARPRWTGLALLLGVLLIAVGCDDALSLSAPSRTLAQGTTLTLSARRTANRSGAGAAVLGDVSSLAAWSSSDPAVAAVGYAGQVRGVAPGSVTITAAYQGQSGSFDLTVSAATLDAITVTPRVAAIAKGGSLSFMAMGTFSDGSSQDLTTNVAWTTDSMVADAAAGQGRVSGAALGQAQVQAAFMGKTGAATIFVNDAALTGLTLSPASLSLARGTSGDLHATGTFSDGTTKDLTSAVSWRSQAPEVLSVSPDAPGRVNASALRSGAGLVSASLGAISAAAPCAVTDATLVSLAISPAAPVLAAGTAAQLTVTATRSDGTTQDVTGSVVWTSSSMAVGAVGSGSDAGRVSALARGTSTLSASLGGLVATSALTVTDAALVALTLSIDGAAPAVGTSSQLQVLGRFSDGTTQDLTSQVAWQLSPAGLAQVSGVGVLTALGVGAGTVTASLGGVSSPALAISPTAPVTQAIVVSGPDPRGAALPKGMTLQLGALARLSGGASIDVSGAATWTSSDAAVATVSGGLVRGVAVGTALITATQGGASGTLAVVVTRQVLTGLSIDPPRPFVSTGRSTGLAAVGTYSDGSTQDLSSQVTWASSSGAVATVSNAAGQKGLATAQASAGATTVSATLGEWQAQVTLNIGRRLYTVPVSGANLGGVPGADAICMGNRPPGVAVAKAMLALANVRMACASSYCQTGVGEHTDWVLAATTPYFRPDGAFVATTDAVGLLPRWLVNPIGTGPVFTGMYTYWVAFSFLVNCNDWTDGSAANSLVGSLDAQDSGYLINAQSTCANRNAKIICAEQ